MKTIPLTQGKFALVDDEDFGFLNQWKWYTQNNGSGIQYAYTNINGSKKSMHRLIINPKKGKCIDHKDHDGLNNQKLNIRECSRGQNSSNGISRKNSSSKFLGVYLTKSTNKWRVEITSNYKRKHIGYFHSEIEAALAYNKAAKEIHGEFANLNQI